MKKWIKYGVGVIIMLILCALYSNVDKMYNVYDGEQDNSSYVTIGPVTEMGSVVQSFKSVDEKMDGIAFKVSVPEGVSEGTLNYALTGEDGREIIADSIPISQIESGKVYKTSFDENVQLKKGEMLTISFGSSGLPDNQEIYLYYEQIEKAETELEVRGEAVEGCMILRTYIHQFDIETFIVTLGFTVYIVVFLRVLYKLFS